MFQYVYCTNQISESVFTGISDMYTLSHSHEIHLIQSKVSRLISFDLIYICFQTSQTSLSVSRTL